MTHGDDKTAGEGTARQKRRRKWWIVLGAVVGAGVLSAAAGTWWLSASSGVQAQGEHDCLDVNVENAGEGSAGPELVAGVCDALATLTDAWFDQDADAYGAVFTEDATYTTFAGTHYVGREEIVRSHEALFDGPLSGTGLTNHYLSLRVLSDDVVILTTRGDTYEGDNPGEPSKIQTYTLVYDGDEWKIASFHNTQRKPIMERIQYLWMPETVPDAER